MISSDLSRPHPRVTLVLGGARSGKSRFAESRTEDMLSNGAKALYLATAEAGDAEMAARIQEHQERRGAAWETAEEPVDIVPVLMAHGGRPVLVDCLTLWLANVIGAGLDADREIRALSAGLGTVAGPVVLVSNEVGAGIVPDNALARAYRDHAGRMNQSVAEAADRVVIVVAGLPQMLKDETE